MAAGIHTDIPDDEPGRLGRFLAALRPFARSRSFVVGAVLFGFVVLVTLLGPFLTDVSPNALSMRNRFQPPSWDHWLGTDNLGRDMLARVIYGAQLSLMIGTSVVLLNAAFGVMLGALAGFYSRLDNILMRVADALMAFPAVLLAIGIAAALGPSSMTAIIALSVVYIPRTARVVRSSVLVVKQLDFVLAARAAGATDLRIILKHILPNSMAPMLVQLSFVFAYSVLSEAVLSFLGLGAPPTVPSWGILISEGRAYMREAAWLTVVPGVAIAVTALGLNLLGDGLRDVLDPRMKVAEA